MSAAKQDQPDRLSAAILKDWPRLPRLPPKLSQPSDSLPLLARLLEACWGEQPDGS